MVLTASSWIITAASGLFVCYGWTRCTTGTHAFTGTHQHHNSILSRALLTITTRAKKGGDSDDDLIVSAANQKSPFVNSRWILRLDFGLEPGSFMTQRFPDWAASGARLGVPVELLFTDIPATTDIPENAHHRVVQVVGNKVNDHPVVVYRVKVSPTFNSTFVSERGEERVTFVGGGYSMERSMMMPSNNALFDDNHDYLNLESRTPTQKPRFLLRFWIDCTSGAKRRDVELKSFTRIFGTIPIWDDPDQIMAQLEQELAVTKTMIEEAKQQNRHQEDDANSKFFLGSWLQLLFEGQGQKGKENDDSSSLEYRQEQLERLLPLKGSLAGDNGVTSAPRGSLVIPYQDETEKNGSGNVKKEKYFIVGSFSMKHSV